MMTICEACGSCETCACINGLLKVFPQDAPIVPADRVRPLSADYALFCFMRSRGLCPDKVISLARVSGFCSIHHTEGRQDKRGDC